MFQKMASRHVHPHSHASVETPPRASRGPGGASTAAKASLRSRARGRASTRALHPVSSHAERAATWLSFACAVHCLVMPLAVSVLPLLGATSSTYLGDTAEFGMTSLVVASALAAGIWGYRRHRDARIVVATGVGLAIYLLGHALGHESGGSWVGISLAVVGGLTLAGSSFLSARLGHACADPSCAT